jgi:predicted NACHT family NTPase
MSFLRSLRPENFEAAIRAQLHFSGINHQEMSISEVHKKTYEWVFEPPKERNWHDFVKWMTSDQRLYWITGKLGSGKSTLMKFIYAHSRTKQALVKWAGNAEVWILRHFFCNSGSGLQMSLEGFIRSILLQALERMPELATSIFEYHYESWADSSLSASSWSLPQLITAFEKFQKHIVKRKKLFLFIDGLDQFEGEPLELIKIIRGFKTFPEVKVCVSSRPL